MWAGPVALRSDVPLNENIMMKSACSVAAVAIVTASIANLAGCPHSGSGSGETATITQAQQVATTADQALVRLVDGNNGIVAGTSMQRDHPT